LLFQGCIDFFPDYIGKKVNTALEEQVDVLVGELDGEDSVVLQMKDRSDG
jgi:pyrimidine operon attenuation protein/uracil phosphoribosyltransferase